MILKGKKVVIMGVRNKWSIAWGAAKAAYDQGAEVICTCTGDSLEKVKELLKELPGSSVYVMEDVGNDENIDKCLEEIKTNHGKITSKIQRNIPEKLYESSFKRRYCQDDNTRQAP